MNDKNSEILEKLAEIDGKIESIINSIGSLEYQEGGVIETISADVDLNIKNEKLLLDQIGISSIETVRSELELRFSTWTYKWSCNAFNVCYTTYEGRVFVIRTANGQTLEWNLMESATKKDTGLPIWSTSPNYHHQSNTNIVNFGFGEDNGRSCHVSTCINCYADWGGISFRWDSTAC